VASTATRVLLAIAAPHWATDLTVDHVVPLAGGGAPFDVGDTGVLCRSCNSTKGASTDRGRGSPYGDANATRPRRATALVERQFR